MTGLPLTLHDAALLRQGTYRMLALLLLAPDDRRAQKLRSVALELRRAEAALAAFAFFVPLRQLVDLLLDRPILDVAARRAAHAELFTVGPDGVRCPPFESSHAAAGEEAAGFIIAQLEHVYRRAGLGLAPALGERPDHVAVELEFMAYLCALEAGAWDRGALGDAIRLLGEERMFLQLHLAGWAGALAARLREATADPLYAATADALEAFVRHDRDLVGALARDVERPLEDATVSSEAIRPAPAGTA